MFELYQTESGAWRFRFKNKQDKTFLMSENYTSKDGAENGIESIKKNASDEANLVKEVASDGRHYFNIKAGNGQIVGTSIMYDEKSDRDRCISYVLRTAQKADVIEV